MTDESYKDGWRDGFNECLDRVRASLREYPNGGGDIEIMKEVDRLIKRGITEWYAEGQR